MKKILMTTCAFVAASFAGIATAQTNASAEAPVLGEVVITAQRREESLQRAALAVAAVGGEQLKQAGVQQASDLTRLVPSLQITQSAAPNILISLRGVSNFSVNPFGDSAVAFNYDGVYVARPTAAGGVFYDLARVEVVKGPQGILYGRNATGGAINVIPNAPVLGSFGGSVLGEVGNYNLLHASGALNIPVGETAALRGAFNIIKRDGYLSDGRNDEEGEAGRLAFKWQPSDDLTAQIGGDYYHQGGAGAGGVLVDAQGRPSVGEYVGSSDPRSCSGDTVAPFDDLGGYYGPQFCAKFKPGKGFDNKIWGVNGTVNWTNPLGDLTLIAGHRDTHIDVEMRALPIVNQNDKVKQDSLELRLASKNDQRFKWLVGGYFFREKEDGQYQIDFVTGLVWRQQLHLVSESEAAFGQVSYAVTEALRLTAGARYTTEEKQSNNSTAALAGPIQVINLKRNWNNTDWRLGLEWDVAPNSLVYANVGTGFRSGGFFFVPANVKNSYEPEYITAYSLGSKNRFMDNRLLLNGEIFRYDYRDQQISHGKLISGVTLFPTENVGKARIQGVEVETGFRLTDKTLLSAQVQYLDAKYQDFRFEQAATSATGCPTRLITATTVEVNCAGRRPPQAPEWAINVGAEQTFPLANGANVVASLSAHHQSETWGTVNYLSHDRIGAWTNLDAFLSYRSDKGWSVTAWTNNLTDEWVASQTGGSGLRVPSPSPRSVQVRPPRTYGLRVNAEF